MGISAFLFAVSPRPFHANGNMGMQHGGGVIVTKSIWFAPLRHHWPLANLLRQMPTTFAASSLFDPWLHSFTAAVG